MTDRVAVRRDEWPALGLGLLNVALLVAVLVLIRGNLGPQLAALAGAYILSFSELAWGLLVKAFDPGAPRDQSRAASVAYVSSKVAGLSYYAVVAGSLWIALVAARPVCPLVAMSLLYLAGFGMSAISATGTGVGLTKRIRQSCTDGFKTVARFVFYTCLFWLVQRILLNNEPQTPSDGWWGRLW